MLDPVLVVVAGFPNKLFPVALFPKILDPVPVFVLEPPNNGFPDGCWATLLVLVELPNEDGADCCGFALLFVF